MMDSKYNELKERVHKATEYIKTKYDHDTHENQTKATEGIIKLIRKCYKELSVIEYLEIAPLLEIIDELIWHVIDRQVGKKLVEQGDIK